MDLLGLRTAVVQEEPAAVLATGRADDLASLEASGALNGGGLGVRNKSRGKGNDGGDLEHHLGGF